MTGRGSELFISDLHLSARAPQIAALFFAFLQDAARNAERLTILGDLFDYWAGDDDLAEPFNASIVVALHKLAKSGVRIAFMAGNRDFLIGPAFAAAIGLELLPDPCIRDIGGIRTLLTHGDALCSDDADYQDFRRQVRDPAWQSAFLARPLAERKQEIETLRLRSEREKRIKPFAIMDVNAVAVATALQTQGADALIHGHTHRQGHHHHHVAGRDATRWVLGDWHPVRGNALVCNTNGWNWLAIN